MYLDRRGGVSSYNFISVSWLVSTYRVTLELELGSRAWTPGMTWCNEPLISLRYQGILSRIENLPSQLRHVSQSQFSIQLNSCQLKVRPAWAACQFSSVSQHANIQTFDNSIETLRWMFPQTFNLSFLTLYLTSSSVCRIVWADRLKCGWSFNRFYPENRPLHSPVIGLIRPTRCWSQWKLFV